MGENLEYYEQRARQERAAAEAATKPEVASAHRLLAIEYEAQTAELRRDVERSGRMERAGAMRESASANLAAAGARHPV